MSNARWPGPRGVAARIRMTARVAVTAGLLLSAQATVASQADLEQLVREQARRLDEQDARLRELERQLAALAPASVPAPVAGAALAQARASPVAAGDDVSLQGNPGHAVAVTATDHAFAIGDAANQLRFHAILNVDGRYFGDQSPPPGVDGWLLRQARPIVEGTVSQIYDFRLTPDFAGGKTVLQDAFVTGRFASAFQLTAGKFKVPFGIERLQYETDTRFIERGLPNNLVPNRDLGVQVAGETLGRRLSYAIALQNGVSDGGSSDAIGDVDNNNEQEFTARLFTRPFRSSAGSFWQGLGSASPGITPTAPEPRAARSCQATTPPASGSSLRTGAAPLRRSRMASACGFRRSSISTGARSACLANSSRSIRPWPGRSRPRPVVRRPGNEPGSCPPATT